MANVREPAESCAGPVLSEDALVVFNTDPVFECKDRNALMAKRSFGDDWPYSELTDRKDGVFFAIDRDEMSAVTVEQTCKDPRQTQKSDDATLAFWIRDRHTLAKQRVLFDILLEVFWV